jgi:hypothetical protein
MALAVSGWLVLLLTTLPFPTDLRATLAAVFLLACPGAAVVRHWPSEDWLERSVLAVGISMALTMVVAEALIVTHTWSVPVGLATLAVITTVGALLPGTLRTQRQRVR